MHNPQIERHDESWSDSDGEPSAVSSCAFGFGRWFGRSQCEVEIELRKKICILKRENRQLRDLAKDKGASVGDIRRATDIFEPLMPVCSSL